MPYKDKEKQKKAQHESYLRNKEKIKERTDKNKNKVKNFLYEYKLKRECEICGEEHPATLDFHHRENEEKKYCIGNMITKFSEKMIFEEIRKCNVLCANCHMKHHN